MILPDFVRIVVPEYIQFYYTNLIEGCQALIVVDAGGERWLMVVSGLAAPVAVTVENADLIVDSGDPMFGPVRLRIGAEAAETLAARLRAQAGHQ